MAEAMGASKSEKLQEMRIARYNNDFNIHHQDEVAAMK